MDNSSHVADHTCSKLSQQVKDNLVEEMKWMRITKTAVLTMQDIAEWHLVGVKDDEYINPGPFDKDWNHQDRNERQEWRDAI